MGDFELSLEQSALLLALAAVVLLILLLVKVRSRGRRSRQQEATPEWERRAVEAEERAERAEEAVKQGLLPHLAQGLQDKLVKTLVDQRQSLLEVQEAAARKTEELEERLAAVQADLETKASSSRKETGRSASPEAAPDGPASPVPEQELPPPKPPEPPRRNPFVKRSIPAAGEGVRFSDIVAKHRDEKGGPEGPPKESPAEGGGTPGS